MSSHFRCYLLKHSMNTDFLSWVWVYADPWPCKMPHPCPTLPYRHDNISGPTTNQSHDMTMTISHLHDFLQDGGQSNVSHHAVQDVSGQILKSYRGKNENHDYPQKRNKIVHKITDWQDVVMGSKGFSRQTKISNWVTDLQSVHQWETVSTFFGMPSWDPAAETTKPTARNDMIENYNMAVPEWLGYGLKLHTGLW